MSIMQLLAGGITVIPGTQSFTTTGLSSFIVPYYNVLTVEMWGGGGSGGYAYNGNTISQGGQGGSYKKYILNPGDITVGSSQSVYVGAGGVAIRSNGGAGLPGDYSYFGNAIWVIGGYGGRGQFASATSASSYSPTVSVPWTASITESGGDGGYGGVGASVTYAGGGGGGGQNTGGVTKAGGTSTYGGNGGQGGWDTNSTVSGSAPGGGGGGTSWYQAAGTGGDGRIVITWS